MKANAPEKIWVHELSAKELNVPLNEYHIEYVRTDAFIEKACEFMRNNIDQQLTIYNANTWKKRDEFIAEFKKYMGEL